MTGPMLVWAYVLDAYEGGLPSASYLGVLADAAEAAGAPEDYVARPAAARRAARPASEHAPSVTTRPTVTSAAARALNAACPADHARRILVRARRAPASRRPRSASVGRRRPTPAIGTSRPARAA